MLASIPKLRQKIVSYSINLKAPCSGGRTLTRKAAALSQTDGITPWQKRQGMNIRIALEELKFDDTLGINIAGWAEVCEEIDSETYKIFEKYPIARGQTGHCQPYYDDILDLGIDGLIDKISTRMATADEEQKITLQSFIDALHGMSIMIANSGKAMNCNIAARCEHLAKNPPRDFREAIQLVWLVNLAISSSDTVGCLVPGRLDRVLAKYYENDLAAGTITRQDALELIEEFYLLVNYSYQRGLAYSTMVGGKDENGNDITNELSHLCFEALRRTNLAYPTVGLCWNEQTPDSLIDLAVELVSEGYTTPAFFGDDVINRGLCNINATAAEACNYINSSCVEITPCNASNIWVASPYFSTCKMLLDEIQQQVEAGKEATTFDEFIKSYFKRANAKIDEEVELENKWRKDRQAFGRKPLQSVFTLDCIERAKDIDDGGARFNQVECSFVGLANLADSLYVLREEVFNSSNMTLKEMHELLKSNFELSPETATRFRNAYPKYGHACQELDNMLGDIIKYFKSCCSKHKMYPDDSEFLPGAFCWEMHTRLGLDCGATPDGRLAGTPFADGAGPAQGRETLGPTAAIISTTSWEHSSMLGGVAYNMKFNKAVLKTPEDRDKLKALIVTYLKRGGFETQINVLDSGVLQKALEKPEDYEDLVVRIGGYTDYFTRLSPEMQKEVMQRMEFNDI